jgi:hypothetical protein
MIRFELPFLLPTLNLLLRETHWERTERRNQLAWWVVARMGRQRPQTPLRRAHVRVERHTCQTLDRDNLAGSVKALWDVLQPMSKRHPAGLGVILNDSPDCLLIQDVQAVRVHRRTDQKTVVIIEEA